ncbi:hypothetical protein EEB12_12165 [Rhodococcus sp. WS1]|nr:hypothetical protein EEB12_12165 [Rhodococcus sp. WS1]
MLGRAVVGSSHRSRGSSVSAPTSILREPAAPAYWFDHLRVPLLQSRGQRTVRDEELTAEVSRAYRELFGLRRTQGVAGNAW